MTLSIPVALAKHRNDIAGASWFRNDTRLFTCPLNKPELFEEESDHLGFLTATVDDDIILVVAAADDMTLDRKLPQLLLMSLSIWE